ncbi:MAG: hypothetical protein AABY84_13050 [Candidatus Firestonebacteria bacterium]
MKIQIIGLGGCGSYFADRISQLHPQLKSNCVAIDSNSSSIGKLHHIKKKILIGKGESALGVYDYGLMLAIMYGSKIKKAINSNKLVIITGCGGTGFGVIWYILKEIIRQQNVNFIFVYPLKCEGIRRIEKAKKLIRLIKSKPNIKLFIIDSNEFLKYWSKKTKMKAVFDKIDDTIINKVINCYYKRGEDE